MSYTNTLVNKNIEKVKNKNKINFFMFGLSKLRFDFRSHVWSKFISWSFSLVFRRNSFSSQHGTQNGASDCIFVFIIRV